MSANDILSILGGFVLLALLGTVHQIGLRAIGWLKPPEGRLPNGGVILTFWSLAVLHFVEIVLCAVVLWGGLAVPGSGTLGASFGHGPADYLYFSASTFVTLGSTQATAQGPIRLLILFVALGGFMAITWSATFLYAIWGDRFRKSSGED